MVGETVRQPPAILLTEQQVREGSHNRQVLSKWAGMEAIMVAIGRACC